MLHRNLPLTPNQTKIENELLSLTEAFEKGKRDFNLGQLVPMVPTYTQASEIKKRAKAILKGNAYLADKIKTHLFIQGVHVSDVYFGGGTIPLTSVAERAVIASNPYKDGSLLNKEWERGFNVAYFANLRRIKMLERKYNK